MKPTEPTTEELQAAVMACARGAGGILRKYFGKVKRPRIKESAASVVTEADLAAEEWIIRQLRRRFPEDGIVAEESGWQPGATGFTWVIDPLDGTSNFVAGLPWFGVQVGVLRRGKPLVAAMYLPAQDALYWAVLGGGAFRDRTRLELTRETRLNQVLCAFGFDSAGTEAGVQRDATLLARVAGAVRNVRMTNSLVDFCLTLEGKLGACLSLSPKIWDIVPVCLLLPEAGGRVTDLDGRPVTFRFDDPTAVIGQEYPLIGASRSLHRQLLPLTRGWHPTPGA